MSFTNSTKNQADTNTMSTINNEELTSEKQFRVHEIRNLTDSAYVLRFDRNGMQFEPGQHLTLGIEGENEIREYSIYSPNNVEYLEVLVKEVEDGMVSKRLRKLNKGDMLRVEGPFGFFNPDENKLKNRKFLFIATGTGIAPFHSIAGTYPQIDFLILHGIRYGNEKYEFDQYKKDQYISCTSGDKTGDFHGRVTDYLNENNVESNTLVYLCGNYEMIHSVYELLTSKGLSSDNIRTEVYF